MRSERIFRGERRAAGTAATGTKSELGWTKIWTATPLSWVAIEQRAGGSMRATTSGSSRAMASGSSWANLRERRRENLREIWVSCDWNLHDIWASTASFQISPSSIGRPTTPIASFSPSLPHFRLQHTRPTAEDPHTRRFWPDLKTPSKEPRSETPMEMVGNEKKLKKRRMKKKRRKEGEKKKEKKKLSPATGQRAAVADGWWLPAATLEWWWWWWLVKKKKEGERKKIIENNNFFLLI